MPKLTNPSEIAREALRQLAVRRVPPTPDNYRQLYHEIAGSAAEEADFPDRFVRQLARRLPRDTAERLRLARGLDQALAAGDPDGARRALDAYLDSLAEAPQPAWNEVIATLLRQWENRQLGWTVARKREALERVLSANDPAALFTRLQALLRSWSQAPVDPEAPPAAEVAPVVAPAASPSSVRTPAAEAAPTPSSLLALQQRVAGEAGELIAALRETLQLALELVVPAFLAEHPKLADEAAALAASARAAGDAMALQTTGKQLRKFAWRLEMAAADNAEVRAGLLQLLRLLLQNIDELILDDEWLQGQVEMLRDVVDQPADLRRIEDAERRLKDLIFKQSQLKHSLSESQRNLKALLAGFVDQLAEFAETTGFYHDRIGACAAKIAAARDITQIGQLLDEVMKETRDIQGHAQRSRDELRAARDRAREAEAHIARLQQALDHSSRLVRHDQLTGALNRRGLEEMFDTEAARATRRGSPLCVALLDVDNFKQLNDSLGHQVGDEALRHLVAVVRRNLRPQDSTARYGGEEFVILYPELDLDQATVALTRLQRELTKTFFLAENQKVMITFSGGVTAWQPGESADAVLKRADAAMYQAKQTGKNKVVAQPAASSPPSTFTSSCHTTHTSSSISTAR